MSAFVTSLVCVSILKSSMRGPQVAAGNSRQQTLYLVAGGYRNTFSAVSVKVKEGNDREMVAHLCGIKALIDPDSFEHTVQRLGDEHMVDRGQFTQSVNLPASRPTAPLPTVAGKQLRK